MLKDEIESLLQQLTTALRAEALTISTAESCTGGLIASYLTALPGSSLWFERGFVTYSNVAKQEMLGVDAEQIRRFGAVSDVVAKAMAAGALNKSKADLALSVTGIAGPDGGSSEKPVGTVYMAFTARGQSAHCEKYLFAAATRTEVRQFACRDAFRGMLSLLTSC